MNTPSRLDVLTLLPITVKYRELLKCSDKFVFCTTQCEHMKTNNAHREEDSVDSAKE